jgi:hypothetical protein
MPEPVPSTPPSPGGTNRTVHYVGLALLAVVVVVGVALIL